MAVEMSNEAMQRFAEKYAAAWCSQDASSVAACYQENGSLKVNDDAPAVGRAAIAGVAQGFMTAFPDLKVSLDRLVFDNDRTIFHWTCTGTNTGPGGTGRFVRFSGFESWEMGADGLIANSLGTFDTADYNRQITGD